VTDLRATARVLAAAKRGDFHPSPEDLESYQAGSLGRQQAHRVLRHLAVCPECARTVLDLDSFPEIEPADPRRAVTAAAVGERWTRFERRLRQEPAPARQPSQLGARLVAWLTFPWRSPSLARAAVALLLVVTAGLSWTLLSQRQRSAASGAPRLNLALAELGPLADSGPRGDVSAVRLSAGADGVVLVLALLDPRVFPTYAVEIVAEASGATVFASRALQKNSEGTFTVELARDFLAAGTYRIDVRGIDGSRQQPLASYRLELVLE
jgi:hypothetical protein